MSKLRLIQCGVGGFGHGWIKNHTTKSPDFDLVAIVDVVEKNLQERGDEAGVPKDRRFATLEAALDKVQADAVLTVTPPVVHAEHAKIAFARGLHLMTEKPLADTIENGREMVKLAEKAGKQLAVSQNYRYTPFVQKIKQMVAGKELGEFGHGHLDFYIPADFTGTFREKMDFPLLVDMSIHHFDLIRCITGKNVRKVTAMSFRPAWSWYAHDPGLKMLLELDSGIPFSYSGDWSARGRDTTWHGSWRLQCENGCVLLDRDQITVARSEKWGKNPASESVAPPPISHEAQSATLHNFAEAIRTGKPAETSGQDNLWSFGGVMAGVISAREKRTVDVAELVGR